MALGLALCAITIYFHTYVIGASPIRSESGQLSTMRGAVACGVRRPEERAASTARSLRSRRAAGSRQAEVRQSFRNVRLRKASRHRRASVVNITPSKSSRAARPAPQQPDAVRLADVWAGVRLVRADEADAPGDDSTRAGRAAQTLHRGRMRREVGIRDARCFQCSPDRAPLWRPARPASPNGG